MRKTSSVYLLAISVIASLAATPAHAETRTWSAAPGTTTIASDSLRMPEDEVEKLLLTIDSIPDEVLAD